MYPITELPSASGTDHIELEDIDFSFHTPQTPHFLRDATTATHPESSYANNQVSPGSALTEVSAPAVRELDDRAPQSRKQKSRALRAEEWEPIKETFADLYVTRDLSLAIAVQEIREKLGFEATYMPI